MTRQAKDFLEAVRKWRWFVAKGATEHIEMQQQICVYAAADLFFPLDTSNWTYIGGRNYAQVGSSLALKYGKPATQPTGTEQS